MSEYRYVILDPTGNLTALVLTPVPEEKKQELIRRLLRESEQVAFLLPAPGPEASEKPLKDPAAGEKTIAAGLRLMGGEFCGNATMAAAAWLLRGRLQAGEEHSLFLSVSGAGEPVPCRIRALADGSYEGTVRMPAIRGIEDVRLADRDLSAVHMEGILHLVDCGEPLPRDAAESLLLQAAQKWPEEEAVGLLQWRAGFLRPLIYVRGSGSLVWENGCGSGSAAIGAWEAQKNGDGRRATRVAQPGGTILAEAETAHGAIQAVWITGRVVLGEEKTIRCMDKDAAAVVE